MQTLPQTASVYGGQVISYVCRFSDLVRPQTAFACCADPDGNKWLDAAVAGRARYLLTEDRALLDVGQVRSCSIVTPADYVSRQRLQPA